jgi:hypothetical protein
MCWRHCHYKYEIILVQRQLDIVENCRWDVLGHCHYKYEIMLVQYAEFAEDACLMKGDSAL